MASASAAVCSPAARSDCRPTRSKAAQLESSETAIADSTAWRVTLRTFIDITFTNGATAPFRFSTTSELDVLIGLQFHPSVRIVVASGFAGRKIGGEPWRAGADDDATGPTTTPCTVRLDCSLS